MHKRTCCDKLWIQNAWKLSFNFLFHSILFFSETATLEKPLSTSCYCEKPLSTSRYCEQPWACLCMPDHTLWKIKLNLFSFSGCLSTSKNSMWFSQSIRNICDQIILRSNWLKAFLAITQEQEFAQMWLFLTAIWLSHGQLWAIFEGTTSLTWC